MNTEQSEDFIEVENTEESTEIEETLPEVEEGEEVEETEDSGEQPKQSRSQNAKQRLRRKLGEAEAEIQRLKEQSDKIAALEEKLNGVINPPKPRPQRVDFETEEDYEDSLFEWRDSQKSPVKSVKPEPVKQQESIVVDKEVQDRWLSQVEKATDRYDDFDDAIISIPRDSMSEAMTFAIMESDRGAEVAYFLGNNHKEASRIARLSVSSQVREIDKLAAKFKTTTSAPDPIKPVHSKGDTTLKSKDPRLAGAKFE